jgi:hypothetical protein
MADALSAMIESGHHRAAIAGVPGSVALRAVIAPR